MGPEGRHLRGIYFFCVQAPLFHLCLSWAAFGHTGFTHSLTFVLYDVRMVLLRFGDVSGCAEWAVPIVIRCWWCESWNDFSLCFTQCAHGFVNVWWCQWMCWMSLAQCDLLLAAWESDWVFFLFYNTVRFILLRFGDVSGCAEWAVPIVICCWWCETWIVFSFVLYNVRMVLLRFGDVSGCAEWAVPIVIRCWWCESWNDFSLCFTQCAHGFVNVWWCQWMCWLSRAQCDLLLVAWESD